MPPPEGEHAGPPPHTLAAEQRLVAWLMLDPGSISSISRLVRPADFPIAALIRPHRQGAE